MNLIDILDIYSLEHDVDEVFLLFNDIVLDNRVNKDILMMSILKDLGAMRPITTDPDLYKMLVDNFFKKYNSNISKLCDTLDLEYNPLYTKDIYHDLGEEEDRHSVGDIDNTDKYTTNTDSTNTGEVSAYDSSSYQPKQKDTLDNDVEHSGETTSDIVSDVNSDRALSEHTVGKDGDTSYQDLIEKQRKVVEFNIYNWIIKQMRSELFLLVY